MRYDLFFLLDSLVVRIFYLKKSLTTLRVVMSVSYTYSGSERAPGCLFKDDSRPGETLSRRYMPYPVGDVCLGLTCKRERLGHNCEVLSRPGSVGGSSWA